MLYSSYVTDHLAGSDPHYNLNDERNFTELLNEGWKIDPENDTAICGTCAAGDGDDEEE